MTSQVTPRAFVRIARKPAAAAVALALVAGATTGCSRTDRAPSRASSSAARAPYPNGEPNSPSVVAAAAVAQRSRADVLALHAAVSAAVTGRGLPPAQVPAQGTSIQASLRAQIAEATRLVPPPNTPAARLVAALTAYSGLAGELAAWSPATPAPASWRTELPTLDAAWRSALAQLSRVAGRNLLAGLPALSVPAA